MVEGRLGKMTSDRMTGLSLELNPLCQLQCPLCIRRAITADHPNQAMPAEVLDAVLPYISMLDGIDLTGWGEPLLNPQFSEFLARIRRSFSGRLTFTTNGLLFDRESIEAVVKNRVDVICFSVDAAAAESYARVRPGANFQLLLSNLKELLAYRRSQKAERPEIFALFLLRREALEELPAFVRLMQSLGLNGIVFQHLTGVFTEAHLSRITYTEYYRSDFDPVRLEQSLAQARVEARPGFTVAGPERVRRVQGRGCGGYDVQKPFITALGEVSICCTIAHPVSLMRQSGQLVSTRALTFGNVKEEPLPVIWQKPEYAELRRQLLAGENPVACADCLGLYLIPPSDGQAGSN
jgi:MoaA/NifB/PqqE/SkfB family radical SAM enzyme